MDSSTEAGGRLARAQLWREVEPIFSTNDGSLPELDIVNLGGAIDEVFECLRRDERRLFPVTQYLWMETSQEEVPLRSVDRPAALVKTGESFGFHCTLVDVTVEGVRIPELGVSVFPDLISIDYRMGPEWHAMTVAALVTRLVRCAPPDARLIVWEVWPDDIRNRAQEAIDKFVQHLRDHEKGGQ